MPFYGLIVCLGHHIKQCLCIITGKQFVEGIVVIRSHSVEGIQDFARL